MYDALSRNEPKEFHTLLCHCLLHGRLLALVRREGGDINRLRRQTAFDRLLCRLFRKANAPWLLKGGYAMQLRIQAAGTTRDIDFAIRQLPGGARQWDDAAIRSLLENAAAFDLEDSFEFIIGEPTMDLDAAPYVGSRYPVEACMAGRRFAKFHVDVSAGDVLREPYEILEGRDWLGFAGLPKANIPAVSREEQFAEKIPCRGKAARTRASRIWWIWFCCPCPARLMPRGSAKALRPPSAVARLILCPQHHLRRERVSFPTARRTAHSKSAPNTNS
jgi:hypothetical protein